MENKKGPQPKVEDLFCSLVKEWVRVQNKKDQSKDWSFWYG